MRYQVVVGNIGMVYDGADRKVAESHFDEYKSQSLTNVGRAGGEDVTLFCDDDIETEFIAQHYTEVNVQVRLTVSHVENERICLNSKELSETIIEAVSNALLAFQANGFSHAHAEDLSIIVENVKVSNIQHKVGG